MRRWPGDYIDKFLCGHVLEVLREIPDESVQCVVTSPPYWSLRDYGCPALIWGDGASCEHEWGDKKIRAIELQAGNPEFQRPWREAATSEDATQGQFCIHCGAWRGSLGLEPTPDLYVQHIVEIFREVRRVLRKDGTCWLNLGDSYAGSCGSTGHTPQTKNLGRKTFEYGAYPSSAMKTPKSIGLKPKDLCGIPWRVALALQADGWWLRSDIIWAKLNPMPESVRDRPTRSHEYVFLLTKHKNYFYDQDAVRMSVSANSNFRPKTEGLTPYAQATGNQNLGRGSRGNPAGRNLRTVWTLATQPFPEAHFATFPSKLIEVPILAGTSHKACPKCGAPWARVVRKKDGGFVDRTFRSIHQTGTPWNTNAQGATTLARMIEHQTLAFRPSCTCEGNDGSAKCLILDPFMGSGTVAREAVRLGRSFIGIDLKQEYIEMSQKRLASVQPELPLQRS